MSILVCNSPGGLSPNRRFRSSETSIDYNLIKAERYLNCGWFSAAIFFYERKELNIYIRVCTELEINHTSILEIFPTNLNLNYRLTKVTIPRMRNFYKLIKLKTSKNFFFLSFFIAFLRASLKGNF